MVIEGVFNDKYLESSPKPRYRHRQTLKKLHPEKAAGVQIPDSSFSAVPDLLYHFPVCAHVGYFDPL